MGNHEYENFEHDLQRWPAAKRLVDSLAGRIGDGKAWQSRWNPADDQLETLIDEWLRADVVVCQNRGPDGLCRSNGPAHCGRRCTAAYWRVHGDDVATNMAALARALGQNERLWWVTGKIHDIDYPQYPHHETKVDSAMAHPMALAHYLSSASAAPALILAILSHAPHLRLRPASPLAWALLACDEHATMTAYARVNAEMQPRYSQRLRSLTDLLQPARSTISGGYYRKDMQGRADLGLQKLLDFQYGAIPLFDEQRLCDPIDWDGEIKAVQER
jgi:predicted hydrolase (HD superfamily)